MRAGSWQSIRDGLAHAFAVGPAPADEGPALPAVLERAARAVVARGLETPVMAAAWSLAPLGFLGGQALIAAGPLLDAILPARDWREAASALEDRRTLRRFAERIEDLARQGRGR